MLLKIPIFRQFLALSFYALSMGFCFCDGFQLHFMRKILWFSVFAILSIYSVSAYGEFDLTLIISISSLLAFSRAMAATRRA